MSARTITTTATGLPMWLRALVLALMLALVLPVAAMADEGTAVADPPAAETVVADEPAPADEATPPAPAPSEPVGEPAPVQEPVGEAAPPPVEETPAEPAPTPPPLDVSIIDPAPAPAPAPAPRPRPVVPIIPVPAVDLPSGPTLAPELPELVPIVPAIPLTPAQPPAAPGEVTPSPVVLIATPPAPPTPSLTLPPPTVGVAAALGIPNAPRGVSIGAPEAPSLLDLASPATGPPAVPEGHDLAALTTTLLTRQAADAPGMAPSAPDSLLPPPAPTTSLATTIQAPVGAAPPGSSLLAVLAGYALPGVGGMPATSIMFLIIVGLVVTLAYGVRPRFTERLHLGGLLGASDGHSLAVARPG